MKKTLLALTVATFAVFGTAKAQTYFSENFNSISAPAIPANWSSTPSGQWKTGSPDALAPNAMAGLGYTLTQGSYTSGIGIDGSLATSNGSILATPTIAIPSGATSAAFFFDKAYFKVQLNSDPSKKETLTFVVSTNGGTTWTDVQEITANTNFIWETAMIPVGTYAGQANLKFGFKYSNTAAALVGVVFDNIKIWTGSDIALTSAIGGTNPANGKGYQLVNTGAPIKGTIKNMGTSTITNYTVWYKQGANPAVSYAATGSIAPLATATFTHATPFTAAANTAYPIKVWVVLASDNDHTNDSTNIDVTGVPFLPAKKLVLEEGTGTWCGWCPRGSVFMEQFAETNVNKTAQIAVHNNDPMEVSAYDNYMSTYVGGFPNMVVDRTTETDPSNIDDVYTAFKDNFAFAEVTMGTPAVAGTTVTVPVTIKPAVSITNPKLSLVVTESNVKGTGAQWPQTNYYAGGGNGVMGGWESQADHVTNVNFHFVARSISPSPAGDAAGLPATLVANTTYTATLTATLNAAWKPADLQYIVLFMNGTDATIMNSAYTALPTLKPGLPTSVANIEAGIEKAQLYPNPATDIAYLQVELKDATNGTLTITDAVGRSVSPAKTTAMRSGTTVLEIPTANLAPGMYLINLSTEKGNVAMKLQVIK